MQKCLPNTRGADALNHHRACLLKHPHDLVLPLTRLFFGMIFSLPQSHRQRHLVRPSYDKTVSFPNRSPGAISGYFFIAQPQLRLPPLLRLNFRKFFSVPQSHRQRTFCPSDEMTTSFPNRVPGVISFTRLRI